MTTLYYAPVPQPEGRFVAFLSWSPQVGPVFNVAVDIDAFLLEIPRPVNPKWWRCNVMDTPTSGIAVATRRVDPAGSDRLAGRTGKVAIPPETFVQVHGEWIRVGQDEKAGGAYMVHSETAPHWVRIYADYPPLHGNWVEEK